MKKLFVLMALSLFGCSTTQVVTCPLETSFNTAFTSGFGTAFNCTAQGQAAMTADLQTLEAGLNLCPAASGKIKSIDGDICVAVVDGFISNYLSNQIPARYQCSPTTVVTNVIAWANAECQKLGRIHKVAAPAPAQCQFPRIDDRHPHFPPERLHQRMVVPTRQNTPAPQKPRIIEIQKHAYPKAD